MYLYYDAVTTQIMHQTPQQLMRLEFPSQTSLQSTSSSFVDNNTNNNYSNNNNINNSFLAKHCNYNNNVSNKYGPTHHQTRMYPSCSIQRYNPYNNNNNNNNNGCINTSNNRQTNCYIQQQQNNGIIKPMHIKNSSVFATKMNNYNITNNNNNNIVTSPASISDTNTENSTFTFSDHQNNGTKHNMTINGRNNVNMYGLNGRNNNNNNQYKTNINNEEPIQSILNHHSSFESNGDLMSNDTNHSGSIQMDADNSNEILLFGFPHTQKPLKVKVPQTYTDYQPIDDNDDQYITSLDQIPWNINEGGCSFN